MKKNVKQVAAIDVAKDELVVCLGRILDDWSPQLFAGKSFSNTAKWMAYLLAWTKKRSDEALPVRFVMEATGVYHKSLAYFLDEEGLEVSIVLPNKISNYMRTLETKTLTDKTASEAIALFGLERKIDRWNRPKEICRKLRQLTRERDQIVQERTIVKNQLHADRSEAYPGKSTLERIKARIKMLDKQQAEISREIAALISSDAEMKKVVKLLTSIFGVGLLTAAIVLGETNGLN